MGNNSKNLKDNPMFSSDLDPSNPKVMLSRFFSTMLALFVFTGGAALAGYFFFPEYVPDQIEKWLWVPPLVFGILGLPATNFGLLSLISPPMKMGPDDKRKG